MAKPATLEEWREAIKKLIAVERACGDLYTEIGLERYSGISRAAAVGMEMALKLAEDVKDFGYGTWSFRGLEETRVDELVRITFDLGKFDWKAAAEEMRISKSRVYQLRKAAMEKGKWDDAWGGREVSSMPGVRR